MERKQELDKEDEEEDKREQEQGPEIESPIASPTVCDHIYSQCIIRLLTTLPVDFTPGSCYGS